ncbi:hypothetical protein V6N13_026627 [Hibiscus sabdariffa]
MVGFIICFLFERCVIVNNSLQLEVAINRRRNKANIFTLNKHRILLWFSDVSVKLLDNRGVDVPGVLCEFFPLVLRNNIHYIQPKVLVFENKPLIKEDTSVLQGLEPLLSGIIDEELWRGRTRTRRSVSHHCCLPDFKVPKK